MSLKNSFDIIKQIQTPRVTLHPEFNCFLTFLGLCLFHLILVSFTPVRRDSS